MSSQNSRLSCPNRNEVICGLCCCVIVGLSYIFGDLYLACLSCFIIIIIIIAWYLIKTGRITTKCFSRISYSNYDILYDSIPVHMQVAGETFQTHETFIQKLKPLIHLSSAESSSVILVFCAVASRIGTDMEAAMARVTEDKPVILVFMHHCHDPSHMTNIAVQPSGKNIIKIVHCAFYESRGLLQCMENEQAVAEVRTLLQNHHS